MAALVRHFDLAAVLCDAEGVVQHTAGPVERYLQFPVGAARLTLADTATKSLRGELLTLMHRCRQLSKSQRGRTRTLGNQHVRLFVDPVGVGDEPRLLVLFVPVPAPEEGVAVQVAPSAQLEDELLATREHLQSLVEELATANEEMQALNEEAQASNEELQATNEELEAANEEMQATNEELVSLNEELSVKSSELSRLAEEYAHLYDALEFPLLVFDRQGQLIRFNASATRRFDLRPTALMQPVARLRLPAFLADLEQRLGGVLAHADRDEALLQDGSQTLRLIITPGLDAAGHISTLVVTLVDVSDITRTQAELRQSQARLTSLLENTTVLFAMKDLGGTHIYINARHAALFGLEGRDYVGRNDFALLPPALAADLWCVRWIPWRAWAVMSSPRC